MVQTTSHIFSGKVDIESNLLVGSSHLFVDTTNNRVGITTADPDASLHVSGNAYVESNVGVGSTIELDGDTGIITATEFRGDGSNLAGVLTSLQNATEQGSTSDATIQLTNPDTSLVASGNVVISGNVTSLTFIGDGSQLTGVATNLQAITDNGNVTSNTVQFTNTGTSLTASGTIKAAAVQVNGLDVAFDQDMTSNAGRIGVLETDLTSNVTRVTNLEAANVVQETLITNLRTDLDSNAVRVSSLETDRTSNTLRISLLESANIVQESLINNLRTDVTSNTGRIADLETANGVQETLITDLRTDLDSNVVRVSSLETDRTSNTSRISVLESANTVQETLITNLRTDVTSNTSRISSLETDLTDNVIRITNLEGADVTHASDISSLQSANTVQGGLITDLRTDVTSNTGRIADLETANGVQATLITNLTTDLSSNDVRITSLESSTGGSTLTLQGITDLGNATTNVVQFSNVTTGLITTANIEVGGDVKISGLTAGKIPYVAADQFLKDSFITTTADTTLIASNLDVTGNIFMRGKKFIVESETKVINDAIIGIANNNTVTTTDVGILMQRPTSNVALIHHGGTDKFTIGYTLDDLEATDITNDTANVINVNILGNLYVQNVVTATSFLGDGTALTGVALSADMTSNAYRINTIETELGYPTFSTLGLDGIVNRSNATANVIKLINATTGLVADGNVHALKFHGDGSELTGISSNLDQIANNGNVTSNTIQFSNAITSLTAASNVVVTGNVTAGYFVGDGSNLTGIATTLQAVSDNGNVTSNTIQFSNATTGFITTSNIEVGGNAVIDSNLDVHGSANVGPLTVSNTFSLSNVATIGTTKTFVVTVSNASGANKYYIDDERQDTIELHQNQTYIFDLSSSTLLTHPFVFQTTNSNDGTTNGTNYDTGITSTGVYGSTEKRTFVIPAGAPTTLYYYCTAHSGMGATISISPTAELVVSGRVVASGNVEASKFIGDGSQLTGISGATTSGLQVVTTNGATTSQAIQFTNTGTSLAASGAVTAASVSATGVVSGASVSATGGITAAYFTGDGSNVNIGEMTAETVPYVDSNKQLRDSHITRTADKTIITSNLEVTGNIFVSGNSYAINSENTVINDRIIGLANNNTSLTLDVGLMLQYPQKNVAMIHHGTTSGSPHNGQLTLGYTQSGFEVDNITKDPSNNLTLNVWGHVVTQNNITVGAQGSYYGDGTTLTGVALETDLSDNVTRISALETATIISNSSTITTGFTKGDIIYASADNVLNKLAVGGTDGHVLKVTSATNKTLGWAAETGGGGGGGGSTPWVTNGNKIHYPTDNVGINVTDPAFKLDVHGTANVGALTATSLSVGGQTLALATDLTANATRLDAIYNGAVGDIIYVDAGNTLTKLNLGNSGDVLTVSSGGAPVWLAPSGGGGGGGGGSSQWSNVTLDEVYFDGNVGIANTNPGHDLSVGSNLFVDDDGSNVLVVTGNTAMSSLTLGQVSIAVSYGLNDILNVSNTSSNIMQLTNATTGLVATGNVHALKFIGDGSGLTGITSNLDQIVNNGNVTSNTVQFSNAITSLTAASNVVVTGNVTAGSFLGDGSLLTGITTIESNVDLIRNTNNTAFINLNSNVVTEFPRSKKIIKYPKVALTQNALNNGYTVTSSTQESSSRAAWKVFNNAYAEGNGWRGTGTYSTSDGSFTGTWVDFSSGAQTISTPDRGDWLQIILPEKIRLEAIRLQPRNSPTSGGNPVSYGRSEFIKNGAIWGSNDGSSWGKVYTINSGLPGSDTSIMTFDGINSTTAYNYFVLVITDTHGSATGTLASFSEWELFGTPEYDPEAYGTDVVVKSLPNVPNTDGLDIYIDGQDYSTMPSGAGSVLDKSTNNRHGTPSNVTFNSTWKAFEIESASTSNITVPFNSTGGAYVHTIALWFWMDTTASDPTRGDSDRCLFTIRGSESTGRQIALIINQDATSVGFKYDFYSADVRYHDPSVVANKWMHVALTYSGGNNSIESKEIYLNGVKLGVTAVNSNPLNLTGTENLLIGGDLNSGNVSFEGMVANFRMFNRVLSKDEIYQLYAYQKEYFGLGDLSMTLKAGRLGIGTSEPRVALDVRGEIRAVGSMLYLLDTPLTHEWHWSGSTSSTTGSEHQVHYNQFPPNCRAIYADVFLPMASAGDHGTHILGESWKNIGRTWTDGRSLTTAATNNARPSTYMTTGVTQGAKVVYIGQPSQSDNFEYHYGNWWQSLIIPLADGNNLYHGRAGYGSTHGWVYVYTKGYYV